MQNILKSVKRIFLSKHCVIRFIMAWCFVSITYILGTLLAGKNLVANLKAQESIEILWLLILLAAVFAGLNIFFENIKNEKFEKMCLFFLSLVFCAVSIVMKQDMYFAAGLTLLMTFCTIYCLDGIELDRVKVDGKSLKIILAISALLFVLFASACGICRYLSYSTPNFDFGIFSQMFYYMKNTFTMNTTCERDMLMSHMNVHVSPVYWLILPFYAVFSSPVTLQFMQAFVIVLGIIPLYFICRKHKFTRFETMLFGVCYFAYPVMSGGTFYDMHENMFLPAALLCLLLAMEYDSAWGIAVSAVFVLGIKEDAAVYAAFVALYMIFGRKMYKKGSALFAVSVIYFVLAVMYLNTSGQGTLTGRFNNMIYENDGNVFGMLKTIIISPSYFLTQVMSEKNLKFIIQVLSPLLFMPLLTKKWPRFILFGPLVLFNLMPDYQYGKNIFFQYVFGSGTLLLYAALLNVKDLTKQRCTKTLVMMLISSAFFFLSLNLGQTRYISRYFDTDNAKLYQSMNEQLKLIPQDASVKATAFLCPNLSNRRYLYELAYSDEETDYVVIDLRDSTDYKKRDEDVENYKNDARYEITYEKYKEMIIFKRK